MNISEILERIADKKQPHIFQRGHKSLKTLSLYVLSSQLRNEKARERQQKHSKGGSQEKALKSREGSNPPELFAQNKTAQRR
jgi:hypothetical protein